MKDEDRSQEAPYTSFELGIYHCDITFDVNSPKFQRVRSEKLLAGPVAGEPWRRKRCLHSQHQDVRTVESPPVAIAPPPPPVLHEGRTWCGGGLVRRYWLVSLFVVTTLCLAYLMLGHAEQLFSCPRTHYHAVIYKELGIKYHLCRLARRLRTHLTEKRNWLTNVFHAKFH